MACLTVLNGPKQGKSIDLLRNKTRIIGRDHTCGVVVAGHKVSRWHCEVFFNGQKCLLTDLDSTNGTRVNGKKRSKAVLKSGDVLKVGPVRFRFELAPPRRSSESDIGSDSTVAMDFQDAFGEDEAALLGLGLEDLEDQLLLAQTRCAFHPEALGHFGHLADGHLLECPDVQGVLVPPVLSPVIWIRFLVWLVGHIDPHSVGHFRRFAQKCFNCFPDLLDPLARA